MEALAQNDRAAELLFNARTDHRRLIDLGSACRPANIAEALAVQDGVSARLARRGDLVGGWKCASPVGDRIFAAPIYLSALHRGVAESGEITVSTRLDDGLVTIEPELAVVLDRDLPARALPYSASEVDSAIGAVRLALEIIAPRYADPGSVTFPELLADGLLNSGLVLGPKVALPAARIPPSFDLRVTVQGEPDSSLAGSHPEGGFLPALYWLVNFLSGRGIGLATGQAIITGSYAGVLNVPLQARVSIAFGSLGTLVTRFSTAH